MLEAGSSAPLRLLGVDGCRAGWVVAESDPALSALTFEIVPTFAALLARLGGGPAVVGVDIPIGLPGGLRSGSAGAGRGVALPTRRRADGAARTFLGPRRAASVFSAPCRPTLAATSYREACALEAAARGHGVGLSQQAYNIIPKIREVDRAVTPAHQRPVSAVAGGGVWVREAHPEVTFAVLAGLANGTDGAGHGMVHSKRGCASCRPGTCPGEVDRLALLRPWAPAFDPGAVRRVLIERHRAATPGWSGAVVGRDDIVDAVACLVTARRIADGVARTFPENIPPEDGPACDARGLRMEIVA